MSSMDTTWVYHVYCHQIALAVGLEVNQKLYTAICIVLEQNRGRGLSNKQPVWTMRLKGIDVEMASDMLALLMTNFRANSELS